MQSYSWYHTDDQGALVPVDTTKWIDFNVASPQLDFGATGTLFTDLKGNHIPVSVENVKKESKALLLHLHNGTGKLGEKKNKHKPQNDGDRAEVLTVVDGHKSGHHKN